MSEISRQIINWYQANKRDLPWRNTTDPYHIWLSEVILQQTRVVQGLSYYLKFLEKFPTVKNLAEATEDEVLELWQGLGYYSRARNLHAAAKYVLHDLNNLFPGNYEALLKMKGIGEYTAAAIASFAYHEDKAAVDGNVIRVLSRLFLIEKDVRLPETVARVRSFAQSLLPPGNAYLFNQGLMELGALVCVPQNPKCDQCPVSMHCEALKAGKQNSIPFKSKAKEKRTRFLNYLLVEVDGFFYFEKRGPKDIWEGLYEPILFEAEQAFENPSIFSNVLIDKSGFELNDFEVTNFYSTQKHILTHQLLNVTVCHIKIKERLNFGHGKWVARADLDPLPKPVIFSKILNQEAGRQLPLDFKSIKNG